MLPTICDRLYGEKGRYGNLSWPLPLWCWLGPAVTCLCDKCRHGHSNTHSLTLRGCGCSGRSGRERARIPPEFLCSGQVAMGGLPDTFHTALGGHLAVWSHWPHMAGGGQGAAPGTRFSISGIPCWIQERSGIRIGALGQYSWPRRYGKRAEGERFPHRWESLVWALMNRDSLWF